MLLIHSFFPPVFPWCYPVLDRAEFATGGELFDRLVQKGAHSEHDAACLIREVTDALAYLHGNDVVHFDIKPENILVSEPQRQSGSIGRIPVIAELKPS